MELKPDPAIDGALLGQFYFESREIEVRLIPDGEDKSRCVPLLNAAVSSIEMLNPKFMSAAAVSLLNSYNEDWRHYSRSDGKGGSTDVHEPELTSEGFIARLKLVSISITGSELCCFGYDCAALFWGHSIFVSSFDGEGFSDLHAELFG